MGKPRVDDDALASRISCPSVEYRLPASLNRLGVGALPSMLGTYRHSSYCSAMGLNEPVAMMHR